MIQMNCPRGHGAMEEKKIEKTVSFKGIDVKIYEDAFVCPVCNLSAGTILSATGIQQTIAEAYREKTGLLTGEDIKRLRKEKGMTQADLAKASGFGIASIKRWETDAVQTQSADKMLRYHLLDECMENNITGKREFSIPRIKLVANTFEKILGRALLVENDKMLFTAKYLWYADMFAKKELGRSMTGASYAHLPWGPQLNNYRDLLEDIRNADTSKTESLSDSELNIISRIARHFPEDQMVFNASHKEPAWLKTSKGELISYSWADKLQNS
ncbi:MAG: helix-turn-helix domain-containing protein [Thermodesulfobacteriota bacterium]|nr:helix-turn-helix domain-containing protein [Thermodesulfobacteriota bacterium]